MTNIDRIVSDLEAYNNPDTVHLVIAMIKAIGELDSSLQDVAEKLDKIYRHS